MFDDPELGDNLQALEELADMGYIDRESPAYGIAQKYLHEGEASLSEKQKYIFHTELAPVIFKSCERCSEIIELSALPIAFEEDLMLCTYHRHKHYKDE
jgi:hypothetical protein